ncbi:MAG: glycosyltransferase family 4 protein [Chromatiales bacterium]|jgi:glycosyltransferase involved in cell wall biosynthesis
MPALDFVLPGDPATATGGYVYDRKILEGLSSLGWQVRLRRLSDGFPFPEPGAIEAAERVLASIPNDALVVLDGLALGAMPTVAESHATRLRLVALVHHPLALETGLDPEDAHRLFNSERRALATVRRVLVTSPATAASLVDYGVAPSRIGIVEPGTVRPAAPGGSGEGTPTILCVAAVVPRKGHDLLLDALYRLREQAWRLICVGSLERSPETAAALRDKICALGLETRVELVGATDEAQLADFYRSADLFVLPSYHEGYGMALTEALAYGLPIISTRAGAIPDTVPTDAALLVPPGDADALTQALSRLLDDPGLRRRLAAAARRAATALPSWADAAKRFAAELDRVATR